MHVGVGYSDHPDSAVGGAQAARQALARANRAEPCDVALLFCTARHNPQALRDAVASVIGGQARIYGGGAVGIITNDTYGYAGDQVGIACIWLDGSALDAALDGGLLQGERAAGVRLGQALAAQGVGPSSPVMLFYDAVDQTGGGLRLIMATWLLAGLEAGLGFMPSLTGAGLQGDHLCSPVAQFTGDGLSAHQAMALTFSPDIRIDSAIMHGCQPASGYYTVTKAEGPMILEINGQPAIPFIDALVGPGITPEDYPFFLLFGINHGEPWAEYDEGSYASRLCLAIDRARGGIIMFEPDMVEGTQFQLMFRSLDLDYMRPKIEALFEGLQGREPVLGIYIDCAGRCAGYGGVDMEDAVVLQDVVGDRVPLLGLYTGVEIAPLGGVSRGLDWTGVFCLLSRAKDGSVSATATAAPHWDSAAKAVGEAPPGAMQRLAERNAAKVLALDTQSIAIRHELEQKRRGFSLLAELSVSLRQSASYESVFIPVAQRINAALNMQKTAVLAPGGAPGWFVPTVLQGFTVEERARLAGQGFAVDAEMLSAERPVLVTGADSPQRLSALRAALGLPYFISSPVVLQSEVAAILITGRMMEAPPFLSRLGRSDTETVQAISALLASVLVHQRLEEAEERAHIMLEGMPLCCVFWDEQGNQTDCNEEALRLFGVADKATLLARFYQLAPERQPDGRPSEETARALVRAAFITGMERFEWTHMTQGGELLPSEVTLVRVPRGEDYTIVGYIRDLREQKAAIAEISRARDLAEQNARAKSEFLASVTHEVRTPVNAIAAMARAVADLPLEGRVAAMVEQGVRSARLLTTAIDSILDFSRIEAGEIALEEKPFAPADTVRSICGILAAEADGKGVALRAEVAASVPQAVLGDAAKLEQAVFNLVANAIKFTDEGEVVIRVSAAEGKAPGRTELSFAVRDTGIGISDAQKAELFEPLSVADASYSRRHSGLGMGLAISRSLARMMDGDVAYESALGQGSTFTLTVRLALPKQAAQAPAGARGGDLDDLAGMRVLVAEDNPINQMIVEELLLAANIHVVTANNGLQALEALEKEDFDLVLMDIQMPEMDGLTAAAQIRANPRYNGMPILAMTANAAAEHREESMGSGMDDHLTKPIDVDGVYAALRRWDKRGKA